MTTATNWGIVSVLAGDDGGLKTRIVSALGPATYSSGGNEIDLSSDATDGLSNAYDMFAVVYGVEIIGVGTAASNKYHATYVPAASYAAATGKIRLVDVEQATPAEPSGDLSTVAFTLRVTGR
jgi:hypothetical protein